MKNVLTCCMLLALAAVARASECTPAGLMADIAQMRVLLASPTPEHVRQFLRTYTDQDELNRHLALKNTLDDVVDHFIANKDKLGLLTETLAGVNAETLLAGPDIQHFSFKPTIGRPMEFVYLKENWTIKN